MFKKTFFILIIISIISLPYIAFAKIYINEILLSPTNDRFIELYNDSNNTIKLDNYYIQRKTENGDFTSLISKTYFNGKKIGPKSYFVISRSQNEISDIIYPKLTLTENNIIQLKNSKREIVDKLSWGEIDDCKDNCNPNPENGKSLQRINNKYLISIPTLGSENKLINEVIKENTYIDNYTYLLKVGEENKNKDYDIFFIIFVLFIIIISILVYYLRNFDYKEEDEFEILDE